MFFGLKILFFRSVPTKSKTHRQVPSLSQAAYVASFKVTVISYAKELIVAWHLGIYIICGVNARMHSGGGKAKEQLPSESFFKESSLWP
jgi:hypothetical protein